MIKRTLFFGNPAYLSTKNEQIIIAFPDKTLEAKTVAIEDIGIIRQEQPIYYQELSEISLKRTKNTSIFGMQALLTKSE